MYASSRRQLDLHWRARFLLRIVPITLFLYQIYTLLQTLRCQTGTNVPRLRFTDSSKVLNAAFTANGGFLHDISSALLFWETEYESCLGANMVPRGESGMDFTGSSTVLWPLFLFLCLSALMETISCALQGRQPMAETGMTIFEHSLAFAEAEAVLRSSFDSLSWDSPKSASSTTTSTAVLPEATADPSIQTFEFTRHMMTQRLNVPPEVLLIGLLSSCSHLSSNVLGLFGLQSRYRLINTSIWGILFMVAFVWSFLRFFQSAADLDVTIIRYPTVCIIGFIPHIMVALGIFVCAIIYGIALLITLVSPLPTADREHMSLIERLRHAQSNLQANASLSNIKISWEEDFYTTLLKVGFAVLTNASEAVYFNEGTNITLVSSTWLEEKRTLELLTSRNRTRRRQNVVPAELQGDSSITEGIGLVDETVLFASNGSAVTSGFAVERKTTKAFSKAGTAAIREEGVGGSQRSGRWTMSWKLLSETTSLIGCCIARLTIKVFEKLNVHRVPFRTHLLALSRLDEQTVQGQPIHDAAKIKDFWMLADDGGLSLPRDRNVDVEIEMRKRLEHSRASGARPSDAKMDSNLYSWWKNHGWWGDLDSSGDYIPDDADDDTTSVMSFATSVSNAGERDPSLPNSAAESDDEDGARTPTQTRSSDSRDSTPSLDDPVRNLAHLLDPKTLEDRQAAKLLARRLLTNGPMTRHRYQQLVNHDHTRILVPNLPSPKAGRDRRISPEEEEELLEQIILSRRVTGSESSAGGSGASWTAGAVGMGSEGPQCVVCHSSPRTILVWPCRCLSLCEDCRVSLAMNNFGSCVCCRRDVVAFSRLYVP